MNVTTGDMAFVIGGREHVPPKVGSIVTIGRFAEWANEPAWHVEPPIYGFLGMEIAIRDKFLRPIRDPGDDAVDETLLRLPSPRQEVTA